MKLADVMSGAGLAFYAEVALLLFLCIFVVVAARALLTRAADFDRAALLPFDDGERDARANTSSAPRSAE